MTRDDRFLLHRLTRTDLTASTASDVALLELVRRAQTGDTSAGEQVLAAMAFPLACMARRSTSSTLAVLVSTAWFVIIGFNTERTEKVLTNLVLDTLKQVTRDRVSRWDENITDHVHDPQREPAAPQGPTPAEEARLAIDAAAELELIDERTTRILQAVYLEGMSGREAASHTSTSHDMVRYRCSRALRLLRSRQQELVEATRPS